MFSDFRSMRAISWMFVRTFRLWQIRTNIHEIIMASIERKTLNFMTLNSCRRLKQWSLRKIPELLSMGCRIYLENILAQSYIIYVVSECLLSSGMPKYYIVLVGYRVSVHLCPHVRGKPSYDAFHPEKDINCNNLRMKPFFPWIS